MKKKALLALALASVISLGAISGSFAQYTREITSGVNTITAQDILFSSNHLNKTGYTSLASATNAAPGSCGIYSFNIQNSNTFSYSYTIDLKRALSSRSITTNYSDTVFVLWQKVHIDAVPGGWCNPGLPAYDAYKAILPNTIQLNHDILVPISPTPTKDTFKAALIAGLNDSQIRLLQDTFNSSNRVTKNLVTNGTIAAGTPSAPTTNDYILTWLWDRDAFTSPYTGTDFNANPDDLIANLAETYQIDVKGTQSSDGPSFDDVA